jgi:1-acyl-sn-glycerol-3-phosphate acyltransferase
MTRSLLIALVRVLTGVRARWVGCDPSLAQRIYFANHTSNLDAVALWASLPVPIRERTRPVAAHDYWTASAVRRYIANRVLRVVLIERRNVTVKTNPLLPMVAALDEGSSLIIFPEGGRMGGDDVGAFKGGIYHLASHRPKIPLIPVWIDNINRVLPKGEFLPIPMLGSVTIGMPLTLAADEPKDAFLERARSAVLALRPNV